MHIDFTVYEVHEFLQHVFWIYTNCVWFLFFSLGVQFLLMCLDTSTHKPLTWEQRLQIALDAAQGMMNCLISEITFIYVHYCKKYKKTFTLSQVWSTCMLHVNQHWFTEMWRVGTSSWPPTLGLRLQILVWPRLSVTQKHISPLNQLVQWAT